MSQFYPNLFAFLKALADRDNLELHAEPEWPENEPLALWDRQVANLTAEELDAISNDATEEMHEVGAILDEHGCSVVDLFTFMEQVFDGEYTDRFVD